MLFLFKKVPDCIEKLSQAGVKIWVLTGDKTETAINIGYLSSDFFLILSCSVISSNVISCDVVDRYACSLLREGMKKILITLDSPDIETLEKQGDKDAVAKVYT